MKRNKMAKDVLIKLINENGEVVEFQNIRASDEDFKRRFHENFYDAIRTYAMTAEKQQLKHYQIIMEVGR